MGKRGIGLLMMVFIFIIASIIPAYAAYGSTCVSVTLPTFKVVLNSMNMDNRYSKYPLIVYKEITYFPMTYNDCRFLGLESNWKGNQEGLLIDTTDITAAYCSYKTKERNKSSYKATIPTFPIKINGKLIDNGKEEYPILLFRDITYFPITWQFAVAEFGWDYSFDAHNGLTINSHNIYLLQSTVPKDRAKDNEVMAIADGYMYYVGTNGRIMQAKLLPSNKVESQVIYQLPFNSLGDGTSYVLPRLYAEEGKAYLTYHIGGGIMGTDFLFRLDSEGATLLNNTRNVRKSFGDKEFQWWVGSAPGPGNLYMKTPDTTSSADSTYPGWEKIGSPDYLYGWNWKINDKTGTGGAGEGGSGSTDCYLLGDELYILAFDTRAAADYLNNGGIKPTTGLYQVNIKTNETKRISDQEVTGFKVEGDYIYYHNRYVELFKYKISEQKEYPIAPKLARGNNFIARFEVLGGQIYFESGVDHGLYDSSYATIGRGVRELKLTGSNKEYVACALSGDNETTDRIILFDDTGRKVFRSSDDSYALTVEGNKVYYFNKSTNTICIGDLSTALK
ncbi:MAG: hypothetical protein WCT23_09470 [Candidatus Neomarinimicrobiota bacterium]